MYLCILQKNARFFALPLHKKPIQTYNVMEKGDIPHDSKNLLLQNFVEICNFLSFPNHLLFPLITCPRSTWQGADQGLFHMLSTLAHCRILRGQNSVDIFKQWGQGSTTFLPQSSCCSLNGYAGLDPPILFWAQNDPLKFLAWQIGGWKKIFANICILEIKCPKVGIGCCNQTVISVLHTGQVRFLKRQSNVINVINLENWNRKKPRRPATVVLRTPL